MHSFKRGDRVIWTRHNGARERAQVIDVGLDSSTVCIEPEGDRPYWVLASQLEPAQPPWVQYTSPVLTRQQVQALMVQLEVADRRGLEVRLKTTESEAGFVVQLVPASEVVG